MKKIWISSICIGLGAFSISYFLEAKVFLSITANAIFALSITAVLELCKVTTIIFHGALNANNHEIPKSIQTTNVVFKIALVFLSMLCSLAIISKSLDRPNMDSIKADQIAFAENTYSEQSSELKANYNKSLEDIPNQIQDRYSDRYEELKNYYEPRIEKEEQLRDAEFQNVVNGVRKGPNWTEHNRQVEELNKKYLDEKNKLQLAEDKELKTYLNAVDADFQKKSSTIENRRNQELESIQKSDFLDDDRAKNQLITSLLFTLSKGLGLDFSYLGFTMMFSLLISALLEGVIFITFNYVILYWENILNPEKDKEMVFQFEREKGSIQEEHPHVSPESPATASGFNNNHAESLFEELFQGRRQTFAPLKLDSIKQTMILIRAMTSNFERMIWTMI